MVQTSSVDNSFVDDSVGFEVDPVDDGSVEDVENSAVDELSTRKLKVQLLYIFQIRGVSLLL